MLVVVLLAGTGAILTYTYTVLNQSIYILVGGVQYLWKTATYLGAYTVRTDTVCHLFNIILIQTGIGTMVTGIDAAS